MNAKGKFGLLQDAVGECKGWDDFQQQFAGRSKKQKGELFEELVKAYLLLDPEYATQLKEVWLLSEVPEEIRKRLNLPEEDQGIDLIAVTKTGEFWAVQCKYREESDQALTWREASTFAGLAFGVCRGITFGLLCSTTERVTHVLKKQNNIGFCALDVWQGLEAEFFVRLRAWLGRKPARIAPLKPRTHQKAAICDAKKHFVGKNKRRGKMIMPCGTGKSLAAYWIAEELGARRIVVAVPSLALIRQTLKVWLKESMANEREVDWICVCSDESAGRIERDDVAVLRQDLGVPCLTDSGDIAKWLGKTGQNRSVVFTTYQSGEAIAEAAKKAKVRFDLGIMDEAHKTVGAHDKLFSHLLYDRNLSIHRRLFMTATERCYQGESDNILSMDDARIYGDTFHLLSFKRALEYKPPILSDYKIVTLLVSRSEVAEMIRKNVFVKPDKGRWDKEIEAEMLAALVALRKAMKMHPIRHAVSFHGSVRRAEVFREHNKSYSKAFPSYGRVESFHVSGKTPTGTRARIVKDFAATKQGLITNARCLTEGVDVPGIDCVLFADPRQSAVDIVQAVGRALRPMPGKKMGYVIVPILHDDKAKPEDIFKTGEFKEVLTILRALAANDDRIIEYFRAISQGRRPSHGGSVEFEMDERLAKRIDLGQFTRNIELKCWDRLARLSWRSFDEARHYAWELGLKSHMQWMAYCTGTMQNKPARPKDIPSAPNEVYNHMGWKDWGDWLGTGKVASRSINYRQFSKARAFARSLKLKNEHEWRAYYGGKMPHKGKLPSDIPAKPDNTYAEKGWKGYGDWLGTGTLGPGKKCWRSFKQARMYARKLALKGQSDWIAFVQGRLPKVGRPPKDIPATPNIVYRSNGWISWGNWLGTYNVGPGQREYRSYSKARAFVRSLRLKNEGEWRAFRRGEMPSKGKRPIDIPSNPNSVYAGKGWKGMGDWLGTGNVANFQKSFRPFIEGRAFAQHLGLKSQAEWNDYCRGKIRHKGIRPLDIPADPNRTYAEQGWQGMGDWLGTGRIADQYRAYRSFQKARLFVHKLKLGNTNEWRLYCAGLLSKKGKRPADIPSNPGNTYASKGWKGMGDWLGTGRTRRTVR